VLAGRRGCLNPVGPGAGHDPMRLHALSMARPRWGSTWIGRNNVYGVSNGPTTGMGFRGSPCCLCCNCGGLASQVAGRCSGKRSPRRSRCNP
jgi:hypothetical protein